MSGNKFNGVKSSEDIIPLVCSYDVVVFPQRINSFYVTEEFFINALNQAQICYGKICLSYRDPSTLIKSDSDLSFYNIGTVCSVLNIRKLSGGKYKVLVLGLFRVTIHNVIKREEWFESKFSKLSDLKYDCRTEDFSPIKDRIFSYLEHLNRSGEMFASELLMLCEDIEDPGKLANMIASYLSLAMVESQRLLSITDPIARLNLVYELLSKYSNRKMISENLNNLNRSSFKEEDYSTKDIKDQISALRSGLNSDEDQSDIDELWRRLSFLKLSKNAVTEVTRQLRRLEKMNNDSSEAIMTRTYIETVLSLPWGVCTEDLLDTKNAKKVLDDDHFSLSHVKDRILEFLAVKSLNSSTKSPILCFVGPPGVGKTSLGKSIAKSIGRKFIRLSLGGIRDEADIRGHRKTYVGAYPGKIIQSFRSGGSLNPVIMLDEIDKISLGQRGDPSAALLEVLDQEQNAKFIDHYLNIPFDLSQTIFIANANSLENISRPLLDRMEIIEINGYSEEEKIVIAKKYIFPTRIREVGLKQNMFLFSNDVLRYLVSQYTRESGLRDLDRQVSTLCRKVARQVADKKLDISSSKININCKNIQKLLGPEKYFKDSLWKKGSIGASLCLAYSGNGGSVLSIETTITGGSGGIILTGHLGEILKESAHTAFSYLKSSAKELGISSNTFIEKNIHIHIPQGAVPKEGPSAGIALACSMLSAMLKKPIKQEVAMTGEISLHGSILPIGGLKEKLLAAKRESIVNIILPKLNKPQYNSLEPEVKKAMKVCFVDSFVQILPNIFVGVGIKKVQKRKALSDQTCTDENSVD